MPKVSAKFDRGHPLRGHLMQVGWVKIVDFPQITSYIWKMVQDTRSLVYNQSFNATIRQHTCTPWSWRPLPWHRGVSLTAISRHQWLLAGRRPLFWPSPACCSWDEASGRHRSSSSCSPCSPVSMLTRSSRRWRQRWAATKLPSVTFTIELWSLFYRYFVGTTWSY